MERIAACSVEETRDLKRRNQKMKAILTSAILALAISTGAALAQSSGSGTDDPQAAPGNTVTPNADTDILRPFYADDAMTQPLPMTDMQMAYDKLADSEKTRVKNACSASPQDTLKEFCDSLS
jgi:hypothetical protein